MSKQLIMENYVDECLDEVEIRGLYITEGVMDTPIGSMLKIVKEKIGRCDNKINRFDDEIRRLKDYMPNVYRDAQIKKIQKEMGVQKVRKMQYTAVIEKLKSDSLLANVPYLYQIIGATMIVAAIGYASYRLYKRFMSKAAKTCQDKKGKVKTICMNQYQIKGLEASKKPFTNGIKNCSKSKEVQACKAKFNKKINAIDKKITKKQNQIKKLMGK